LNKKLHDCDELTHIYIEQSSPFYVAIHWCDLFCSYVLCQEWPLCPQQAISLSESRPDNRHQNGNWYQLGSRMGDSDTMDGVEKRKVVLTLSSATIFQLSIMQTIKGADLSTGFEYFMKF
jgi:hypothetical protein